VELIKILLKIMGIGGGLDQSPGPHLNAGFPHQGTPELNVFFGGALSFRGKCLFL